MPITTTRRTWIDGGIIIAAAGALIAVGALRQSVQDNGQHIAELKSAITSLRYEVNELRDQPITAEASRRIAVLESKAETSEKAFDHLRQDMNARFDRLERKLDKALQ